MKKIAFFISALFVVSLVSSCSTEEVDKVDEGNLVNVQFYIQPVAEINNFPSSKAIPGGTPEEPQATKGDVVVENSTLFSANELYIYSYSTSELINTYRFLKDGTNDDFGTYVTVSLAPGTYTVALLAHSATSVDKKGNVITLSEMSDAYYVKDTSVIQLNNVQYAKSLTLTRCVSKVEFVSTDCAPSNVTGFNIEVAGQFRAFDMLNGYATSTTTNLSIPNVISAAEQASDYRGTYSFYSFVPNENATVTNTVLTSLAGVDTVRSRDIVDIPIYVNQITRYTGILYSPSSLDAQFDLTVDNDWGTPVENALPD